MFKKGDKSKFNAGIVLKAWAGTRGWLSMEDQAIGEARGRRRGNRDQASSGP